MISPIVRYTKWDCKSYFGSASHVFLSYRLSQWYTGSKLGLFLALDRYIKLKLMLQVYFFVWCDIILWQDIVVKTEKTIRAPMEWELIPEYWVKNIGPFVRLSVRLFVRLFPWDHSGSVNKVNLFKNFTRYFLIFLLPTPYFNTPCCSLLYICMIFPSTEFLRMYYKITYPRFFPSTEFLRMYNKTNYSKIE